MAPSDHQLSSLGLLDEEHMATFRNALEKLLLTEVSESTYAEIVDGLPTLDSWNVFHFWVSKPENPIKYLEHKELCAGSREKAKRLRAEFDIYILRYPTEACLRSSLLLHEIRIRDMSHLCVFTTAQVSYLVREKER